MKKDFFRSLFLLVPKAGFEPARSCLPGILSPLCLPFHHFGKQVATLSSFGGTTQIRTGGEGFADLCLTTWLWCHVSLRWWEQ